MKFLTSVIKIFLFNALFILFISTLFAFQGRVLFSKGEVLFYDKKHSKEKILKIEEKNFDETTIKTKKNSKVILFLNDEIEIRCSENSKIRFEKDYLKILSGKVWIRKFKSLKDLKIKINSKEYSIKYGSFNVDIDKNFFNVYDGVVFSDNKEIKKNNINFIDDEWINWNLKYDKLNIVVVINNEKYRKEVEEAINTFLKDRYIFSEISICNNSSEIRDKDLIFEFNITDTGCFKINTFIKDGATFEILNLINEDCGEKEFNSDLIKPKLTKIFSSILNNIENNYFKNIIKKGRNIIIESEILSENDFVLLSEYIGKISNCEILKKDKFYDQKVIFLLKYYGTGDDLKDFLDNKIIDKNKINVWKYSKNIVKLGVKRE